MATVKVKSSIEVNIDDKLYQFVCDSDSPLGAVHDALCQMRILVVQKIAEMDVSKQEPKQEGS